VAAEWTFRNFRSVERGVSRYEEALERAGLTYKEARAKGHALRTLIDELVLPALWGDPRNPVLTGGMETFDDPLEPGMYRLFLNNGLYLGYTLQEDELSSVITFEDLRPVVG
jgi:hypothetical protein